MIRVLSWRCSAEFYPTVASKPKGSCAEVHLLRGQMAVQGAGKRPVLFGELRVGAIHELPRRESDLSGHGPRVVRAIRESPLPQSDRFPLAQRAICAIHELSLPVVGRDEGNTRGFARASLTIAGDWTRSSPCLTGWPRKSANFCTPRSKFLPNGSFESG